MHLNLQLLAQEYGSKNLRVIMPAQQLAYQSLIPGIAFIRHDAAEVPNVEFEFDETFYKLKDGFKLKLVPASVGHASIYGSRTFYISDFESIAFNNPDIRVMVLTIDGYTTLYHNREKAHV